MIVIFGATGRVGGAAAAELRRRGRRVRAVTRDPGRAAALARIGCAIAAADLHDGPAVERALDGAEAALVLCPLAPQAGDALADAQRILDAVGAAIASARPSRVVALSDYGAHLAEGTGLTMIFHHLEERLRAIPAATTFLRSAEHMEGWAPQARSARRHGVLPTFHAPLTKLFPMVSAADVGRVAADLLAGPDDRGHTPRFVHVEGPRRVSATDVAAAVESLAGRPIAAQSLEREGWERALVARGAAASYARLVAGLYDAHNAGRIDVEPGPSEVRRGATEIAEALRPWLAPEASG